MKDKIYRRIERVARTASTYLKSLELPEDHIETMTVTNGWTGEQSVLTFDKNGYVQQCELTYRNYLYSLYNELCKLRDNGMSDTDIYDVITNTSPSK